MQTRSSSKGERRGDQQVATLAWASSLVLDGAPLPSDASIRDFQGGGGKAGYMANSMEQALLLPKDMTDLRSMRKHEVFLDLKRGPRNSKSFDPLSLFHLLYFYFSLLLFLPLLNASLLGRLFKPCTRLKRW